MKLDDICLYRFFNDTEGENWKKYLDKIGIVYKDLRYDPSDAEYYLTKTAVLHRTLKAIKEDDALI